jgi:hypothetical protein
LAEKTQGFTARSGPDDLPIALDQGMAQTIVTLNDKQRELNSIGW